MSKTPGWWVSTIAIPLLGLSGTAILCLAGNSVGWVMNWLWGGPAVSIIIGVTLSASTIIFGVIESLRKQARIIGDHNASIKKSLLPTTARMFEGIESRVGPNGFAKIVTEVMRDLRAHVGTNGTNADANFYLLTGAGRLKTELVRVNESDTGARVRFRRTKGEEADPIEETAAIDRICNKRPSWAKDVTKEEFITEYALNPDRSRDYRSFMTVPVVHEDVVLGMLSVNSDSTGVIQNHHYDYLYFIAQLIARFRAALPEESAAVHTGVQAEED